jgi:hypothetical protein
MLSGEATNTNFIVFGLTRPELEPTIYHTQGEHANHYATDPVPNRSDMLITKYRMMQKKSSISKYKKLASIGN